MFLHFLLFFLKQNPIFAHYHNITNKMKGFYMGKNIYSSLEWLSASRPRAEQKIKIKNK
jgi:hypothetical protein